MCSEEKKNKEERHFEFISQNLAENMFSGRIYIITLSSLKQIINIIIHSKFEAQYKKAFLMSKPKMLQI